MSYSIKVTSNFAKEAKRLAKKHPSFKKDYEEFKNSLQAPHVNTFSPHSIRGWICLDNSAAPTTFGCFTRYCIPE